MNTNRFPGCGREPERGCGARRVRILGTTADMHEDGCHVSLETPAPQDTRAHVVSGESL